MTSIKKIDGKAYSIGSILKSGFQYRVPTYQRDFAWTADEVELLWNDITRGIESKKKEYFIGAVVTSRTIDNKKMDIVDGQQRLAVITMLFTAIADAWQKRGDSHLQSLVKSEYLGDVDKRTMGITPKLTLNENNDAFYQSFVINGEPLSNQDKKALIPSNKLIFLAYTQIIQLLDNWLQKSLSYKESLIQLEEFLADSIYAILIETGDESDAFITFETLNGRGLELATSDLVKNLLFSKAGGNIDEFKKLWGEVVLIVGSDGLTQFIRYFWNAYYSVAREKELYRSIKSTIDEASSASLMMKRLRNVATYHDALNNPDHPYWAGFSHEYKQYLNALNLFKVSQYKPILFAAMDFMSHTDVTKLLKLMLVLSFRYTVISGLNTGNLEKVYPFAAIEISSNRKIKLNEIFNSLKDAYVDDAKFELEFRQKHFDRENIAKYVLKELNDSYAGNELTASDRMTVEHILPKNPDAEWQKYLSGSKAGELVYLIGNLTLLSSSKNRNIGNSSFQNKKEKAFNESELPINEDLKGTLHWSKSAIIQRTEKFAKKAVAIWRVDY
jgi:hypothetical protein